MADKIPFDLVSPERLLLSEEAEMVTIPGTEGEMGVMSGHMPLISTLRPGLISVRAGTKGDQVFFISGGFAEITPTKLTVLAEDAVPMGDFDVRALDARITDAEQDVLVSTNEFERAKAAENLDHLKQLRAAF